MSYKTVKITLDARHGDDSCLLSGYTPEVGNMCCLGVAEMDRGVSTEQLESVAWPEWTDVLILQSEESEETKEALNRLRDRIGAANIVVYYWWHDLAKQYSLGGLSIDEFRDNMNHRRRQYLKNVLIPLMKELSRYTNELWDIDIEDIDQEDVKMFLRKNDYTLNPI